MRHNSQGGTVEGRGCGGMNEVQPSLLGGSFPSSWCMRSKTLTLGCPHACGGLFSFWHQCFVSVRNIIWLQVSPRVTGFHCVVSLIDLMSVHGASVIFQAPGLDLESPKRTRQVWALCLLRLPCNRDTVSDKLWLYGVNCNQWRRTSAAHPAWTWVSVGLGLQRSQRLLLRKEFLAETWWVSGHFPPEEQRLLKNASSGGLTFGGLTLPGWSSRRSPLWGAWRVRLWNDWYWWGWALLGCGCCWGVSAVHLKVHRLQPVE